jgi:hypothetical protein
MGKLFFISLSLLLSGCGGQHKAAPIGAELHQTCPEQRSEVCTREYAPVCAFMQQGGRQQYSNACTACGDHNVVGYIAGHCPADVK